MTRLVKPVHGIGFGVVIIVICITHNAITISADENKYSEQSNTEHCHIGQNDNVKDCQLRGDSDEFVLEVQTKYGRVRGGFMQTEKNRNVLAFRGIPYAKPPIGKLRFQAPMWPDQWTGVFDATEDGGHCLQYEFMSKAFTGQEDCLYLNVYSPVTKFQSPLPVMVFIHGGGFSSGSASSWSYGPQKLLDKNILLVAMNYRVAAFGFFSTGDSASPGNNGLLDQVQALRWVQENIGSFGGDPNRVTIFGESAGSASVFYHMLSPLSKGLFHGAIAQSGSPIASFAFEMNPRPAAILLGERLGCATKCSSKLVECLRKKPAVDIMFASNMNGTTFSPLRITPVADVGFGGSFLPDDPYKLFEANKLNAVPVIGGINKNEGIMFHFLFSEPGENVKDIDETKLRKILSGNNHFPFLDPTGESIENAIEFVKTKYFKQSSTWQEKLSAFDQFYGDSFIKSGVDTVLSLLTKHGVPTYVYKLTHRGANGVTDILIKEEVVLNELKKYVSHADDLQYLFHRKSERIGLLNQQDQEIADLMLELWTTFAETGVPSVKDKTMKQSSLQWDKATNDHFSYLDISSNSKMVDGHLASDAWVKLYNRMLKAQHQNDQQNPIVVTSLGPIKGSILKSDKGADIFAFRGIPYAQPPVGNLRFEAPQPFSSWNRTMLDATEDKRSCIQWDFFFSELSGDEDCLYANVYTPKLSSATEKVKLAVMVFIHGGGFFSGSGKSTIYGPQRIMDKDVVLVTFNYRVGPIGFFSTGDESAPGNFGFLDQVLLLRWVREHIGSFGGDPDRVTIFGESAGAASVMYHVISPLSNGLFHAAISQSGSSNSEWSLERNPKESAKIVASKLHCPSQPSKDLVACLKKKTALDIVYLTMAVLFLNPGAQDFIYHFKPVVDKVAGENAFLPEDPCEIMLKGRINDVSLMTGVTRDEGAFFFTYLGFKPGKFNSENIEALIGPLLRYKFQDPQNLPAAAKAIEEHYRYTAPSTDKYQDFKSFMALAGDLVITYDVTNDIEVLSKRNIYPYVYKLTHTGEQSYSDPIVPKDLPTAAHVDDLQYLFHLGYLNSSDLNDEDQKMADVMLTLWTNFAKTKIPTLDGTEHHIDNFVWKQTSADSPRYLDLNTNPHMVDGILCEHADVLRSVYKQTTKPNCF